jgi:hypothetical protein
VNAAPSAINLGQLPVSLVLFMAPRWLGLSKVVLAAIQIVNRVGILALLAAAPWLRVAGAGIIGFDCAFSLIVTLALPPQLALAADVPRLSAGCSPSATAFSCLIPIIGSAIWDLTNVPAAGFAAPAVASVTVFAFRFPSG